MKKHEEFSALLSKSAGEKQTAQGSLNTSSNAN